MQLITVTADNVGRTGFFCKMSARGKPGYERKQAWLKARFAEGLEMRLLDQKQRGFVEFIPGKFAWRSIENAEDYMVVHCLWVVGKSKGKDYGSLLLDEVVSTAHTLGFAGVAAVTSKGNWMAGPAIFENNGFVSVARKEPNFDIMVHKFQAEVPDPVFCNGWEKKLARLGDGVVVLRSDQCPYIDDAAKAVADAAKKHGIAYRELELKSAADIRAMSPTPYGNFAIVRDGKLLSYCYQLPKDLDKMLA